MKRKEILRISSRIWIVLAIIILSAIGDMYYYDEQIAAGQTFDFSLVFALQPIFLIIFYVVILIFTVDLLVHNDRNLVFSISLILVGLFVIWICGFPFSPFFIPQSIPGLRGVLVKVFSSRMTLTINSGAFFTVAGFLRLLPPNFLSKKTKK